MKNLDNLIIQYQKTKDKKTLNDIFILLKPIIKSKSSYVFYRKNLRKNDQTFKLYELGTITINDIEQELRVLILRLINDYNGKASFSTYLYSSIWNWGNSLSYLYEGFKTTFLPEDDEQLITNPNIEIYNLEGVNMTYTEKRIFELFKENQYIKQSQIAERLGVTQARLSQIIKKFRKKITKYLTQ